MDARKRHSPLTFAWRRIVASPEFYSGFIIATLVLFGDLPWLSPWKSELILVAIILLVGGLVYHGFREYRLWGILHRDKPVPLLLAVGVPLPIAEQKFAALQESISEHTGFKEYERVERHFNVSYKHLIVHQERSFPPDEAEWEIFFRGVELQTRYFLAPVTGPKRFHVAAPPDTSSLALALGVILGTDHPTFVYYERGGEFKLVIDLSLDSRRVKAEPVSKEFQFISVNLPDFLTEDTVLVLNLASHNISGSVATYVSSWAEPPAVVEVNNTYGGNITIDDWTPIVQEVFAVFNQIQKLGVQTNRAPYRVHLFHAMPPPLAIGLGMALGSYMPITVYHWYKDRATREEPVPYYPILQLNRLQEMIK